jgi:predicted transcriptional regulator
MGVKRESILALREKGKKYKEISQILNISLSLVEYHIHNDRYKKQRREKAKNKEFVKAANLVAKNSCNKATLRNKQITLNYLKTHPCVDCGNSDVRVLEFDHVRGVKINSVSAGVRDSWSVKKLLDEIDKCEIRCANCHKIVTDKRRKKIN